MRFPEGVRRQARTLAWSGARGRRCRSGSATRLAIRWSNVYGAEGSALVFVLGWTLFLLPWAILVLPIATSTFPRLSALQRSGDDRRRCSAARAEPAQRSSWPRRWERPASLRPPNRWLRSSSRAHPVAVPSRAGCRCCCAAQRRRPRRTASTAISSGCWRRAAPRPDGGGGTAVGWGVGIAAAAAARRAAPRTRSRCAGRHRCRLQRRTRGREPRSCSVALVRDAGAAALDRGAADVAGSGRRRGWWPSSALRTWLPCGSGGGVGSSGRRSRSWSGWAWWRRGGCRRRGRRQVCSGSLPWALRSGRSAEDVP